jgi:hypothetical protein
MAGQIRIKRSFRNLAVLLGFCNAISSIANAAVDCTVCGYMRYEPVDYYYCDTDRFTGSNGTPSCSGWLETDLDEKRSASGRAAPLKYMLVEIRNTGGALLGKTHTSASGYYSKTISLPGSSCTNQSVKIRRVLQRVHENDRFVSTPRYRFRIVDRTQFGTHYTDYTKTLAGATTTCNLTRTANSTTEISRGFSTYFTMNSAMTEAVRWSSNINSR